MTTARKTATTAESETSQATEDAASASIIVDLGKAKRKDVRKLRKGKEGKLMDRVSETIDHLRETKQLAADSQVVVIVIRQRARRRPGLLGSR